MAIGLDRVNGRRKVLSQSARQDFERNRHVDDPVEIAKMIYIGRHCMTEIENKVIHMHAPHAHFRRICCVGK